MIDEERARMLLNVGHGIGVLSAHAMLRSHHTFRDADLVVRAQELADAFRDEGEPHVADAIEQFIRDEYGKVMPAVEGRVTGTRQIPAETHRGRSDGA